MAHHLPERERQHDEQRNQSKRSPIGVLVARERGVARIALNEQSCQKRQANAEQDQVEDKKDDSRLAVGEHRKRRKDPRVERRIEPRAVESIIDREVGIALHSELDGRQRLAVIHRPRPALAHQLAGGVRGDQIMAKRKSRARMSHPIADTGPR